MKFAVIRYAFTSIKEVSYLIIFVAVKLNGLDWTGYPLCIASYEPRNTHTHIYIYKFQRQLV